MELMIFFVLLYVHVLQVMSSSQYWSEKWDIAGFSYIVLL